MKQFSLKKGLDLPVGGVPEQRITDAAKARTVGVLGRDYLGIKPRLLVKEGDAVGAGAPLFAHKDSPDAPLTSPVSGRVIEINRGYRRALLSVVVEADEEAAQAFNFGAESNVLKALCASGLWSAFRTRPYSKIPATDSRPAALFVNAMDTEPLAADPSVIIADAADAFQSGLSAVASLFDVPTYLCQESGKTLVDGDVPAVEIANFSGPHPAGLTGTHIHFLRPPTAEQSVWSIGYQDVIAIGRLLATGELDSQRVVSLAGPMVQNPRLVRTVAGANLRDLLRGEYTDCVATRIISGSILSGHSAASEAENFLGRYARAVTVIEEDRQQNVLGWIRPMPSKFAYQPVLGSALSKKRFPLTSNMNGGRRAMVPLGTFEELMPQDYLPTQLLRALLVMDTDMAQALGVLELDEEDLGLVGFACPAKYEYGLALRDCLNKIEKDG
ncbi:MAG: Na(+)-translocating NADH-quinone reductase subunit A [Pseudomonadota bacterium]